MSRQQRWPLRPRSGGGHAPTVPTRRRVAGAARRDHDGYSDA
eukprot:CAMPEP_0196686126 /NCGR_PEP_ID=MMETSP1090-20130531/11927_1 /TAXON_ID=37098 /ORGANISM="Isochrysis sp, Strain CCMP1244" /LENGTH=41 /DNA_ID= /DNA_START= /DNA_END= /DNA_ORIENTATION=